VVHLLVRALEGVEPGEVELAGGLAARRRLPRGGRLSVEGRKAGERCEQGDERAAVLHVRDSNRQRRVLYKAPARRSVPNAPPKRGSIRAFGALNPNGRIRMSSTAHVIPAASAAESGTRTAALTMFGLLLVSYTLMSADRYLINMLGPDIRKALSFSLPQMGALTTMFTLGIALAGLPGGAL